MAEPPADDEQTRVDEWAAQPATEVVPVEALPVELLADPNTDRHRLQESADFLAGCEIGQAEGYTRGLAEGRSEVLDAFRRALIASGTDPTIAFVEMQKLQEWARRHPAE